MIVPQDDYFPRIREICDKYEVLMVSDEVITGFGRTGTMFGLEHWGVKPDLIQFAKAITSGYFPLGGVGASDEIVKTMEESGKPFMHAYTYSAHPVGCAIANAMLDVVQKDDFPGQAAAKGKRLLHGLKDALGDHPNVGEVRGLGLMCAVEYVRDRDSKTVFDASENVGPRVHAETMAHGLFSRVRGDAYCLAPPIVTDEATIDRIVEIMADATKAVLG